MLCCMDIDFEKMCSSRIGLGRSLNVMTLFLLVFLSSYDTAILCTVYEISPDISRKNREFSYFIYI